MFEAIAQKVASTAIALGTLFFASVSGTNATFDDANIDVNGSKIVISAQLENCFTEELDRIFQSGQKVRIYFRVSVHNKEADQALLVKDFFHQIRYSLIDNYYEIYLSEKDQTRTAVNLNVAHREVARIDHYEVIDAEYLDRNKDYYIKITAYMQKIQLPGMQEDINLMSYWNGVEPVLVSNTFDKSLLAL